MVRELSTCILLSVFTEREFLSGTKNVPKQLGKITMGSVRDGGVTRFHELVNKRKSQ